MSDDQLRPIAASALYRLFSASRVPVPISSLDLLTLVISNGPPSSVSDSYPAVPAFRLTDLSRFESTLESLARQWNQGTISVMRDGSGVIVLDVKLGTDSNPDTNAALTCGRKRKRIIDEDADSAAGSGDEAEEYEEVKKPATALESLSKELKDVYAILQRSTAKGCLLAEQVRVWLF
jgi:mRNA m6A methyltransferase catalytic subunit